MFPWLAVLFAVQGMTRAFGSTSSKPAPVLVKTWPDEHKDAPLSDFANSLHYVDATKGPDMVQVNLLNASAADAI